jgi:tetratricopeptide (TPR) repeat protein
VSAPASPPVRVDKALGLLPELEALAPLKALLVSIARPNDGALWSSSGPYLTLGKRGIQPGELARQVPQAFHQITEHLGGLYKAYIAALECEQQGDGPGVALALIRAGQIEESVGRFSQARAWFDVARGVSETLQDRRPEVESLRALGQLALTAGEYVDGARHFQRALALAEAEFDQAGAIAACEGLGAAALGQGQLEGAHAWYARGLRLAEASGDRRSLGRLERQLSTLARRQGDLAKARDHLARARELIESSGRPDEMARILHAQGQLEAWLGRHTAAAAAYREALAWTQRAPRDMGLELDIRLGLSDLLLDTARLLEAEEEMRRAEQVAIAGHATRGLVQVYTLMGKLRGRQQDETGFVFFEEAIVLNDTLGPPGAAAARVYLEYALFREAVGQVDEARAYLERARELFKAAGETGELERAEAELQKMSA